MAVCPVCHSEIQITSQHHGTLFTCPSCSGVFFVDWSGNPEAASSENETDNAPIFSEIPEANSSMEGSATEYAPAPHFDTPTVPEPGYEESPVFGDSVPEAEPMFEVEPSGLSDIADFGNADLSQSAFNYTLIISDIDSSALRAQIQEALSDSKFGWNVIQLMSQIKGGVLTIRSVNAIKASILMQRVKYLPVKVSWRQDVLSSSV